MGTISHFLKVEQILNVYKKTRTATFTLLDASGIITLLLSDESAPGLHRDLRRGMRAEARPVPTAGGGSTELSLFCLGTSL